MQYEDERGAVYYIAYIGRSRWGICRDTKAKRYGWREAKPAV